MSSTNTYRMRDRGSALVAAVGVSIIGMMLSVVVVAQAVMVTNDSQRDRVRTTEVHAAEAAVDATLASLRIGPVCSDTLTYGDGPTEVTVDVSLEYFTDDPAAASPNLTCASGVLNEIATKAIITAVATPVNPGPGAEPERTVQATVNLQAIATSIPGAALFSGGVINPGGGYLVSAAAASEAAAVWQDSGDWLCNPNNTAIEGSVYVVDGTANFQSRGCHITGNLYASDGLYNATPAPAGSPTIGGNATIFNGDVTLSNRITIGGNLAVGGNTPTNVHWSNSVISGTVCSDNETPCPGLEYYTPVGLPEIVWEPGDWTGEGWAMSDLGGFRDAILAQWSPHFNQSWKLTQVTDSLNACTIPANWDEGPVRFPETGTTNTVYDMRGCNLNVNSHSGNTYFTMNLYADTALIVNSFSVSNGIVMKSGDGQPHQVMIMVMDTNENGVAECSGGIGGISLSANAIDVQPPISIFMYSPCTISFQNRSTAYGQVYGGNVTVGQTGTNFIYEAVSVPGVELTIDQSSGSSGYYVQIASKREMR